MLSDVDREMLEASAFDPHAAPAYNEVAACLVWTDEVPPGLSADGYDYVRDLLAARGYIHRRVPIDRWDSPERLERWNDALAAGLHWNGFRRLALEAAEQQFLDACLADDLPI